MYGFGGFGGNCCCRPIAPVGPSVGVGVAIIAVAILILIALAVIF